MTKIQKIKLLIRLHLLDLKILFMKLEVIILKLRIKFRSRNQLPF